VPHRADGGLGAEHRRPGAHLHRSRGAHPPLAGHAWP
jgi:hypothetical protein